MLCCALGAQRTRATEEELVRPDLACGPTALATSASLLNRTIDQTELSSVFDERVKGEHTLAELQRAARRLGLATIILRHDPTDLRIPKLPLIIAINESPEHAHFVVLYGQSNGQIQLLDSPRKPMRIELTQLDSAWNGIGMYVARDEASLQEAGLVPKWKSGLLAGAAGAFFIGIYLTVVSIRRRGSDD